MAAVVESEARTPLPPLSGDVVRLTCAQALVRYLQAQFSEQDGVRQRVIPAAYGIFGHGNVAGLGEALAQDDIDLPLYQGKNEQAMVHAAIGYAKASRRRSTLACLASIGPGSTNMVTGAAAATVNRLPVLLLAADTFANRRQGTVLQQIEHPMAGDVSANDCLRPVSRYFDRIARPEQLLTALPEAMRVLLDPAETGAVTIALHQDVQGEAYDYPAAFFRERVWHMVRRPPAEEELGRALATLRSAQRPLLVCGGGVHYSGAHAEVVELSERFGIPAAETFAGKGAAAGAELAVGAIGHTGTTAANDIAGEADVVLCVGTRLQDFITGSHSLFADPDVRFVGVNVCAPDAHKLGAEPVLADAKLALRSMIDGLAAAGWETPERHRSAVRAAQERWASAIAEDLAPRADERMSQGQLLVRLNAASRPGDVVIGAAGSPPADLHKLWDCVDSAETHIEFGFSCMAHEIPAALGWRAARPDAGEIYVVVGDGTWLMGATELVTAVQERWKVTVLLVENGGFQSIRGLQIAKTDEAFATEFRARSDADSRLSAGYVPVDYAANARSLGCAVHEVHELEELDGALAAARATDGPVVIVAHVEPSRLVLGDDCFWDVGVAEVSTSAAVMQASSRHFEGRAAQRFYG